MDRPDTLDPALLRPGRLDRKVEFGLPDLESRTQIFKIHTRTMNCERDIRFELLSRLCPNSTGLNPFLSFSLPYGQSVWKLGVNSVVVTLFPPAVKPLTLVCH